MITVFRGIRLLYPPCQFHMCGPYLTTIPHGQLIFHVAGGAGKVQSCAATGPEFGGADRSCRQDIVFCRKVERHAKSIYSCKNGHIAIGPGDNCVPTFLAGQGHQLFMISFFFCRLQYG